MKAVSILGSTGSIGCNTLTVIDHLSDIRVVAMAAGSNTALFAEQIGKYKPELISCRDESSAERVLQELHSRGVKPPTVETGEAGMTAVATHPAAETVVSAAVGAVGFVPTLRAVEAGKRLALANKETLVMGGELITNAAAASGAEILPVDSEHNAIHQCLRGEDPTEVKRLILTASGGPFRNSSADEISSATREQALKHPRWVMGEKITIDSATLMNKGLEVIEAKWLFGFSADQISVIIHPQSVVHSMVEMVDGSLIAQMGVTDMKHAIQYALTYPARRSNCTEPMDLGKLSRLDFEEPDLERFPCLQLAYDALRAGGTMPVALNAANEVSVQAFLDGKIKLSDIAAVNGEVMKQHLSEPAADVQTIMRVDRESRSAAESLVVRKARNISAAGTV